MRPLRLETDWNRSAFGPSSSSWGLSLAIAPVLALWTLPQTLAGLTFAVVRQRQGAVIGLYQFGPFPFLVVRAPGPSCDGISLGLVIFAVDPTILRHEFCHLFTGLWLSWSYLPVYGLEYLIMGHDRSFHERTTCWLEGRVRWPWHARKRGG